MVGFYILLPSAIRNYICCLGNKFKKLTVIATKEQYSSHDNQLAYYALAFVGKTVKYIYSGRCTKSFKTEDTLNFKINLCFRPFDFMNAAIMMKDKSIAVLQALDPKSVKNIIDDGIQLGLKVRKSDNAFPLGGYYFERYEEVIKKYYDNCQDIDIEIWTLIGNKNCVKLEIENPHWSDEFSYLETPLKSIKKTYVKDETKDEIQKFLNEFMSKVCDGAETTSVDDNNNLQRRFDLPCNCERKKEKNENP